MLFLNLAFYRKNGSPIERELCTPSRVVYLRFNPQITLFRAKCHLMIKVYTNTSDCMLFQRLTTNACSFCEVHFMAATMIALLMILLLIPLIEVRESGIEMILEEIREEIELRLMHLIALLMIAALAATKRQKQALLMMILIAMMAAIALLRLLQILMIRGRQKMLHGRQLLLILRKARMMILLLQSLPQLTVLQDGFKL